MRNYVSKPGQSLNDICVQIYGSLDFLFKLMQDNKIKVVDSVIESGTIFIFDSSLITRPSLFNSNKTNNIIYATIAPRIEGDFNDDFSDDFSGG